MVGTLFLFQCLIFSSLTLNYKVPELPDLLLQVLNEVSLLGEFDAGKVLVPS